MKKSADSKGATPTYNFAVRRAHAAKLFDVSPGTFDDWVRRGLMPKGVKIGSLRRWDTEEIRTYWHDIKEQGLNGDEQNGENPFDHAIG